MRRAVPIFCLVTALVLVGAGAYSALNPVAPAVIEQPEMTCDLGTVEPGEHEFVIRLRNTGGRPGRIVGFNASCALNCCFKQRPASNLEIPPGATTECRGLLTVDSPGPFEGPVHLFYFDTDIREVTVMVKGTCAATKGAPNDPPKK